MADSSDKKLKGRRNSFDADLDAMLDKAELSLEPPADLLDEDAIDRLLIDDGFDTDNDLPDLPVTGKQEPIVDDLLLDDEFLQESGGRAPWLDVEENPEELPADPDTLNTKLDRLSDAPGFNSSAAAPRHNPSIPVTEPPEPVAEIKPEPELQPETPSTVLSNPAEFTPTLSRVFELYEPDPEPEVPEAPAPAAEKADAPPPAAAAPAAAALASSAEQNASAAQPEPSEDAAEVMTAGETDPEPDFNDLLAPEPEETVDLNADEEFSAALDLSLADPAEDLFLGADQEFAAPADDEIEPGSIDLPAAVDAEPATDEEFMLDDEADPLLMENEYAADFDLDALMQAAEAELAEQVANETAAQVAQESAPVSGVDELIDDDFGNEFEEVEFSDDSSAIHDEFGDEGAGEVEPSSQPDRVSARDEVALPEDDFLMAEFDIGTEYQEQDSATLTENPDDSLWQDDSLYSAAGGSGMPLEDEATDPFAEEGYEPSSQVSAAETAALAALAAFKAEQEGFNKQQQQLITELEKKSGKSALFTYAALGFAALTLGAAGYLGVVAYQARSEIAELNGVIEEMDQKLEAVPSPVAEGELSDAEELDSEESENPEAETEEPEKPEAAKAAEHEKPKEPAKTPEPAKALEMAKAAEPSKAPEPAKTAEHGKAPEPAKALVPDKASGAEKTHDAPATKSKPAEVEPHAPVAAAKEKPEAPAPATAKHEAPAVKQEPSQLAHTVGRDIHKPILTAPAPEKAATRPESLPKSAKPEQETKPVTEITPKKPATVTMPLAYRPLPKPEPIKPKPRKKPAKPAPKRPPVVAERAPASTSGDWAVNLIAVKQDWYAKAKANEFRQKGVPVEVVTVNVDNVQWYRLRVSGFNGRDDANAYANRAKKALNLGSVWVGK